MTRCSPKHATRRRPERDTFGPELASIAAKLGQPFMPWQRDAADVGCEIDPDTGRPAYRKVIVTVPRQSGKTTLFLTWQLNRCLSPRWAQPQRSAFTAQSGKDARDKWLDELFPLIRRSAGVMPLVSRMYEGMGNEYIRFRNGSLIRLLSTSSSSGHSKTLHQAVLDEIWHDYDNRREQGLSPAMITVADAQLLVCSTAGDDSSVVLDRQVELGRAAVRDDSGQGIAYVEYSAPDGWNPADEESYFGFMPALCPCPPCRCGGGRWRHTVTMDAVRGERTSMEPQEFARAYGNIPVRAGGRRWEAIAEDGWRLLADPESEPDVGRGLVLAAAFSHDQSKAAVGLAGWRADGLIHLELADYRPGTSWAEGWLADRWGRHNVAAEVVDAAGHERVMIKGLEARRVTVLRPGAAGVAEGYSDFMQDLADKRIRHRGQKDLDDAASVAVPRDVGDAGQAWGRRKSGGDISPLVAVTNAAWGLRKLAAEGGGAEPGAWLI